MGTKPASKTERLKSVIENELRQIMAALYKLGKASATQIREALPDPPTYTAVRTHLTLLQEKGLIKYESDGTRYIHEPVIPRDEMSKHAIEELLQTFFDNSVERFVATLVRRKDARISREQLDRLGQIIEQAKSEGR
jgi:predicted transcriptional regulator